MVFLKLLLLFLFIHKKWRDGGWGGRICTPYKTEEYEYIIFSILDKLSDEKQDSKQIN